VVWTFDLRSAQRFFIASDMRLLLPPETSRRFLEVWAVELFRNLNFPRSPSADSFQGGNGTVEVVSFFL